MNKLQVAMISAMACLNGLASEAEVREALFATTNYWGKDAEAFVTQVSTNCRAIWSLRTPLAMRAGRDFYEMMMDVQAPTNNSIKYWTWMKIWGERLSYDSSFALTADCTNLWMRHAALYSELEGRLRPIKDIVDEARRRFPIATSEMGASKIWIHEQSNFECGKQRALNGLIAGLHKIGTRGVAKLPADMRWQFYTNFVERAGLDDWYRGEIRKAIEREEKKEMRSRR